MNFPQKAPKTLKNSDSDYKAEDEGSASDNPSWRKYNKKSGYPLKLTKKQMIENSIRTLIPMGVNLKYQAKITPDQYEELINVVDVQELQFRFRVLIGKVVQIVDGENFKVIVHTATKIVKIGIRLNGINTPDAKRNQTKQYSNHVKKILKSMIQGKIVRIQTGQYDKSGNILSRVFAYSASPLSSLSSHKNSTEFCINDYLIEHDMAKSYHRNRNDFSKKGYEQFCQKYQTKQWPIVQNYPIQLIKQPMEVDYDQKEEEDDS